MIKNLRDSLDRLPMGERINGIIDVAEDAVVDRIRDRLEAVTPSMPAALSDKKTTAQELAGHFMAELSERANTQSAEDAKFYMYAQILQRLVPDELRILSALSDGQAHAMIHVAGGPPIGPIAKRVMENYSYVGRSASIRLVDHTPAYLAHMMSLGLVQKGPEDKSLEIKYEVLANDKTVRALGKTIEKEYKFPPRILRRVVKATDLGLALWKDCSPAAQAIRPVI